MNFRNITIECRKIEAATSGLAARLAVSDNPAHHKAVLMKMMEQIIGAIGDIADEHEGGNGDKMFVDSLKDDFDEAFDIAARLYDEQPDDDRDDAEEHSTMNIVQQGLTSQRAYFGRGA